MTLASYRQTPCGRTQYTCPWVHAWAGGHVCQSGGAGHAAGWWIYDGTRGTCTRTWYGSRPCPGRIRCTSLPGHVIAACHQSRRRLPTATMEQRTHSVYAGLLLYLIPILDLWSGDFKLCMCRMSFNFLMYKLSQYDGINMAHPLLHVTSWIIQPHPSHSTHTKHKNKPKPCKPLPLHQQAACVIAHLPRLPWQQH